MFSEHTLAFEHTQDTVFNAFASLPPDFKWGDGMLYPDTTTQPSSRAGDQRLVLRDAKTVIEEYTETLIEIDAPVAISLTLTLDDFAMSRNAPTGHLLPSAASMARARKHISEGRATNLIMSLTLSNFGAATNATLIIANQGQTGPKFGARIFKRFAPNPAKTLLDWLAHQLNAPTSGAS
jgi:hypothetical protein